MKYATQKTIHNLEILFEFCPPDKLREHILYVFFNFLADKKAFKLAENRKEIMTDFHFLIKFLELAEKKYNSHNSNDEIILSLNSD